MSTSNKYLFSFPSSLSRFLRTIFLISSWIGFTVIFLPCINFVYSLYLPLYDSDTIEVRSNLMCDTLLIQTFYLIIGQPNDFQARQIEKALGVY